MKKSIIVLTTLFTMISYVNGQTLAIQDLITFSKMDTPDIFSEAIVEKNFNFFRSNGNPEVFQYVSEMIFEVSPNSKIVKPNSCSFSKNNTKIEVGFKTVDTSLYVSLLEQLKSEDLKFSAQETTKHSFRNGFNTKYTSELFPTIELMILDVVVNENAKNSLTSNWHRYEFQLTNNLHK